MNVQDQIAPVDSKLFRRVMGRFATGVTVITAEADGGVRGMTANAFMSGSLSPPLCIVSVAKKARLHKALDNAGHFGISMLAQGQEAISQHFAGQGVEQPEVLFEHMSGVPVLAGVCAAVAAEIVARHDCGDHSLFIGHILAMRDDERPPLVFHAGKYASVHYRKEKSADPWIDFWELIPE
jgi:flavin reductase (DIM6/NTAB) family NADH-FMN oxidoreductase RutF